MLSNRQRQSGSVLILVLWVLFALAALTVAVGSHVASVMALSERLWNMTLERALAEAGVNQACALVMGQTNGWDGAGAECWNCDGELLENFSLEQGRFSVVYKSVDVDGNTVTNIGVVGENARININQIAGDDIMRRSLENLITELSGGSPEGAKDIVSAIAGTSDGEDELTGDRKGSNSVKQSRKEPDDESVRYGSVIELQRLKGMDDALYRSLSQYLTVYGAKKDDPVCKLNLNSVSAPVLQAFAAACDGGRHSRDEYVSLVSKIIEFRKGGGIFDSKQEIEQKFRSEVRLVGGELSIWRSIMHYKSHLDVASSAFRGTAFGMRTGTDDAGMKIEFVFDAGSGRIVYWHEMQ